MTVGLWKRGLPDSSMKRLIECEIQRASKDKDTFALNSLDFVWRRYTAICQGMRLKTLRFVCQQAQLCFAWLIWHCANQFDDCTKKRFTIPSGRFVDRRQILFNVINYGESSCSTCLMVWNQLSEFCPRSFPDNVDKIGENIGARLRQEGTLAPPLQKKYTNSKTGII